MALSATEVNLRSTFLVEILKPLCLSRFLIFSPAITLLTMRRSGDNCFDRRLLHIRKMSSLASLMAAEELNLSARGQCASDSGRRRVCARRSLSRMAGVCRVGERTVSIQCWKEKKRKTKSINLLSMFMCLW